MLSFGQAMNKLSLTKELAESEGFEPSIQLPVYLLSREALSTTQPTLRFFGQEL